MNPEERLELPPCALLTQSNPASQRYFPSRENRFTLPLLFRAGKVTREFESSIDINRNFLDTALLKCKRIPSKAAFTLDFLQPLHRFLGFCRRFEAFP
jgi:hypothetical protein